MPAHRSTGPEKPPGGGIRVKPWEGDRAIRLPPPRERTKGGKEVIDEVWLTMVLLRVSDRQEGTGSGPREVCKLWSHSMTMRPQPRATHTGKHPRAVFLNNCAFLVGLGDKREPLLSSSPRSSTQGLEPNRSGPLGPMEYS